MTLMKNRRFVVLSALDTAVACEWTEPSLGRYEYEKKTRFVNVFESKSLLKLPFLQLGTIFLRIQC